MITEAAAQRSTNSALLEDVHMYAEQTESARAILETLASRTIDAIHAFREAEAKAK